MLVFSCGGPSTDGSNADESADAEFVDEENDEETRDDFLYTLPSPLQISSIFRRSGLEFIPELTSSPDLVSNYNTKLSQKLNFGVYTADLAYSSLNNQNQDCIDYIAVISSLSESLWMTNIFASVSILERFENNLGDSDSLGYIIADFQMELDSYLDENGLSTNSLIIFTGAWIECMYLAFKSIENQENSTLEGRLIEQSKICNSLIAILQATGGDDPELAKLLTQLKQFNENFVGYDIESIEDAEGLAKLVFTPEQRKAAIEDITTTRNLIING